MLGFLVCFWGAWVFFWFLFLTENGPSSLVRGGNSEKQSSSWSLVTSARREETHWSSHVEYEHFYSVISPSAANMFKTLHLQTDEILDATFYPGLAFTRKCKGIATKGMTKCRYLNLEQWSWTCTKEMSFIFLNYYYYLSAWTFKKGECPDLKSNLNFSYARTCIPQRERSKWCTLKLFLCLMQEFLFR